MANVVLATCESDYATMSSYFGGVQPSVLPINIIVVNLEGLGAYHYSSPASDIYCDIRVKPKLTPRFTAFAAATQLVELFEMAQAAGWRSESSNGESLSRVLAASIHPNQLSGFATAHRWLDSKRPDFVNHTAASDSNPVANGCGVLFLNYLRHRLGHGWTQIVRSGRSTLRETYAALTGDSEDPFPAFRKLLHSRFPIGTPSALTIDNPFPAFRQPVIKPIPQVPHPPHATPHPPHTITPHPAPHASPHPT